jgi:cyanuric acid amidohydrolase
LDAKTEGTATTNDYSRYLAKRALDEALQARGLGGNEQSQIVLSTGCEGVISPGGYILAATEDGGGDTLAIGLARSPILSPEEMIADAHIAHARDTVEAALADAGLSPDEAVLVLMKSPLLTYPEAVGLPEMQRRWAGISGASRGVAALGIGIALGEIVASEASAENVLARDDLYTRRGMVFSGTETRRCEAIVLGNRRAANGSSSGLSIRSGRTADLIDIEGMSRVIAPDGNDPLAAARQMVGEGRIVAAFLKAGVARDGHVRGRRTTVFSSDLDPDKHMRAAASGALAALIGDCRMFVSGGCEHQAPDGGGLLAVVTAG